MSRDLGTKLAPSLISYVTLNVPLKSASETSVLKWNQCMVFLIIVQYYLEKIVKCDGLTNVYLFHMVCILVNQHGTEEIMQTSESE
jgi:hypothetical protein